MNRNHCRFNSNPIFIRRNIIMSISDTSDTIANRDKWFCVLLVEQSSKWGYQIVPICQLVHTSTNENFLCTHPWLQSQLNQASKMPNVNRPVMVRIATVSETEADVYNCRSSRAVAIFELYEEAQDYVDKAKASEKRFHVPKNLQHTPASIKISKKEFSKLRKQSDGLIAKKSNKNKKKSNKQAIEKQQAELRALIAPNESDAASTPSPSSTTENSEDYLDKNVSEVSGAGPILNDTSDLDRMKIIHQLTQSTEDLTQSIIPSQHCGSIEDVEVQGDDNSFIEMPVAQTRDAETNGNDSAKAREIQLQGKSSIWNACNMSQNSNILVETPTTTPRLPKQNKVQSSQTLYDKMCRTTSTDSGTSQSDKMVTKISEKSAEQTVITTTPEKTIGKKRNLPSLEKQAKKKKSTPRAVDITVVSKSVEPRAKEKLKVVTKKQFTAAMKNINEKLTVLINATNESTNNDLTNDDSGKIPHDQDQEGKVTLPCGERVFHSYIMEAKETSSQSRRIKKIMSAMWTQSEMGHYILKHRGVQTENRNYTIMPQEYIDRIKKVYDFLEVNHPLKNKENFDKNSRAWISEKLRQCRQYDDPEKREKIRINQVLASQKFKEKKKLEEQNDRSNEIDGTDESSSETDEDCTKKIEKRVEKAMDLMIASDWNYTTTQKSPPVNAKKLASILRVDLNKISELTVDCLKTKNTEGAECYRLITANSELKILTSMVTNIEAQRSHVTNVWECTTLERISRNGTCHISPKIMKYILSKYMDTDSSGRLYIPRQTFIARGVVFYVLKVYTESDANMTFTDVLNFCRTLSIVFFEDMSDRDWVDMIIEYADIKNEERIGDQVARIKENKRWDLDAEILFREKLQKLFLNEH